MPDTKFADFPTPSVAFYSEMEVHKATYETACREPMQALLDQLETEFGASKMMRPYRDIRFSADKSPYKTSCSAMVGSGRYVGLSSRGLYVGGRLPWARQRRAGSVSRRGSVRVRRPRVGLDPREATQGGLRNGRRGAEVGAAGVRDRPSSGGVAALQEPACRPADRAGRGYRVTRGAAGGAQGAAGPCAAGRVAGRTRGLAYGRRRALIGALAASLLLRL